MKFTISKSQWENMGKTAGWMQKIAFKSRVLSIYKKWLSTNPPPQQIEFVDDVYKMCEDKYEQGGDVVVEAYGPEEIIAEFKSLQDVLYFIKIHKDQKEDVVGWGGGREEASNESDVFNESSPKAQCPTCKSTNTQTSISGNYETGFSSSYKCKDCGNAWGDDN